MSVEDHRLHLPDYDEFNESIATLALDISASELHGIMCGYLCAGAGSQGEAYLRALSGNKKDQLSRTATLAMFAVFSISQQQIANFDFEFELLVPEDELPLIDRARAFSEWCKGFTQGLSLLGIGIEQFYEEEAQDALQHLTEFAELDCDSLDVDEEDERALMEVSEYARMAVIRLHSDLVMNERKLGGSETTH
ncbi:UPF0149 family protein [Legionella fallonii]|uniref:YecA family protein n=1 Tax=Legionella fallonii LLAP-10 TaxID=1212491 RepID=A0A098FZD8_9GAMM|nr:UPF0149 family protein [Legionella fallonii]CEG55582.1 conserved protein of unknown function [Legionella fallonii LLAP-10]